MEARAGPYDVTMFKRVERDVRKFELVVGSIESYH